MLFDSLVLHFLIAVIFQIDEFMLYSEEDDDADEEEEGEEEESSRDGGYIALGGVPHHSSHSYHHSFRRKRSFMQVSCTFSLPCIILWKFCMKSCNTFIIIEVYGAYFSIKSW